MNDDWIPISSGILPNNTNNVIVTIIRNGIKEVAIAYCGISINNRPWYICTKDDCDFYKNMYEVVAWKPFPKFYKE